MGGRMTGNDTFCGFGGSSVDFMNRGPVDFIVIEFPGPVPGRTLAPAINELVDKGVINLIDMVFVHKGQDGSVIAFETNDEDDDILALASVAQSVDGLIAEQDILAVGAGMLPGATAVALLFENQWARKIREVVNRAGGEVVLSERITAPVVDAVEDLAMAAAQPS
jgi:uncharacterized membrane protein